MATYYIQFEAVPTESNEHYSLVDGALVNCWVLAGDPQSALSIANFYVAKHDWLIEKTKTLPVVTTRTNFIDKDLGLKNYDKAQEDGVSVVYITLSKDRKTTAGPIPLKPSWELNIAEYLGVFKRAQKSGRCLHYDSGKRCNKIINAHSIQKMGVLSEIPEDGHVYRL